MLFQSFPSRLAVLAAVSACAAARGNYFAEDSPCHFGECEWSVASDSGYGVLRVTGSHSGISDLTSVSGWAVLECDKHAKDQDIRIVCHDPDLCEHLYKNGAEHTLVRLPDECGSAPFAIVRREWDHEDQYIPASKRALLTRRDGTLPTVKGISITSGRSSVDSQRHGDIAFFAELSTPPLQGTSQKRDLVRNSVLGVTNSTNSFDKNITSGPHSFDLSTDPVSLFNRSAPCPQTGSIPGYEGVVNVGAQGRINGSIAYGAVVAGTLVPPNVTAFELFASLDADVDAQIALQASLTGTISTGRIEIVPALGIPGLGIEGVLAIGPFVAVYAQADASLGASVDLEVDLSYSVAGAELSFPPSVANSTNTTNSTSKPDGSLAPGNSALKLAANPSVPLNGKVSAHIIPSLALGINLLDGYAQSAVSIDFDTSAALSLSLTPASSASTSKNASSTSSSAGTTVGGCVDASASLALDATADADLHPFFDAGDSVPLLSKTFELYQKCFGSSVSARESKRSNVRRAFVGDATSISGAAEAFRNRVVGKVAKLNGCSRSGSGVQTIVEEAVAGSR